MPRVEVLELAGGGAGVARHEGKVWFVRRALPGEVVEAVEERQRAGIVEARAVAIEQPSPWREPDFCPVAGACGGCDLAHVRRESTTEVLRAVVRGALRHAPPALASAVESAAVEVSPLGWRMRARLHWDAAGRRLGFRGHRSHRVVDISPCRVLGPGLSATHPGLAAALADARCPDGEVEWIESLDGRHAVASWLGPGRVPHGPVAGLDGWHRLDAGGFTRVGGWGATSVRMELPMPLDVPVGAFFQGNRHLAPRLFDRVAALVRELRPGRVVDLYGGVGFLAAAARHAGVGDLTVVESHALAAGAAARNLPGARVEAVPSESFLDAPGVPDGCLALVDPPRVGLSRAAVKGLVAWHPAAVLLLSCDPAAGGRDLAALAGAGYRLADLELWDLFAGSHHVEMVAVLVASGG